MIYLTQSVHRNCQKFPNKIMSIHNGRERTWIAFQARVSRFAAALQKLGLQPNDRIAILALNSDYYLEYYLAVLWAGGAVVPLNTRWSVKENAYSLSDSGSKMLLVDDAFMPQVEGLKAENIPVENYIYIGESDTPSGLLSYEQLINENEPVADAYRHDDDLAGIFYTGGTTGFPKGAMLTHKSLWTSTVAVLLEASIKEDGVYMHAAPMFHLADGAFSNAALLVGAAHCYLPNFTPQGTVERIQEHKVTHTVLVPIMIQLVTGYIKQSQSKIDSLKFVLYGASPIPESVLIEALAAFPTTDFAQGYGQTELSPIITMLPPKYHVTEGPFAGKLKSAGRAGICIEIRIVDKEDQVLGPNEIGEVTVMGPNRMLQYWNKPEETATSLRNGWIYTGDVGYLDEEGFLFLVDRAKDMIVTGGENVYSTEVENAVMDHPSVQQCIVIGIPDEKWGELVHAEIILHDNATTKENEITDHCRTLIANYKCPKSIKFRTEPFPISGAGKLLKREVRKTYWEGKDRAIN